MDEQIEIQNHVQSPPPREEGPGEVKHSHHFKSWVALGLVLLAAAAVGCWAWSKSQELPPTPSLNKEGETGTPSFTKEGDGGSSELAAWQTYRNEEFGFEFRYNSSWKLSENKTFPYIYGKFVIDAEGSSIFLCLPPSGCQDARVIISILNNSQVDQAMTYEKAEIGYSEDIVFAGMRAVKVIYPAGTMIFIQKDNAVIIIKGWILIEDLMQEQTKQIHDQILSTFKFIK